MNCVGRKSVWISCPKTMHYMTTNQKGLLSKKAMVDILFPERMKDNIMSIDSGPE